jgi:hypothetical protein
MNLTRHNYEEYFLLYVDGELAADERLTVEAFLAEHLDLAEQMEDLQRAVLSPEETFSFDKDLAYRFAVETPSKVVSLANRKLSWAAAAVVVGIAAGSLWLLEERVGPHPAKLPVAAVGTRPQAGGSTESSPAAAGTVPVTAAAGTKPPTAVTTVLPLTGSRASVRVARDNKNPKVPVSSNPAIDPETGSNGSTPLLQTSGIAQLTETHPGTLIPQGSVAGGPHTLPEIVNKIPSTVTTQASPSYHTIEDGDQEAGGDKILFVQADQVVNGEVKGFFRRAGRLIKRSTSFNTDNVHPDPGTDK